MYQQEFQHLYLVYCSISFTHTRLSTTLQAPLLFAGFENREHCLSIAKTKDINCLLQKQAVTVVRLRAVLLFSLSVLYQKLSESARKSCVFDNLCEKGLSLCCMVQIN